jgi:hypothetical protein
MSHVSLPDLLAFVGLALLGTGLWMLHPAASLVTIGLLLLAAAVWTTLRAGGTP